MLFMPSSLLVAAVAAFSTFTAVSANIAPHSGPMGVQAVSPSPSDLLEYTCSTYFQRAELFDAVADLIERSETEQINAVS